VARPHFVCCRQERQQRLGLGQQADDKSVRVAIASADGGTKFVMPSNTLPPSWSELSMEVDNFVQQHEKCGLSPGQCGLHSTQLVAEGDIGDHKRGGPAPDFNGGDRKGDPGPAGSQS
jgi:hypothetical protein